MKTHTLSASLLLSVFLTASAWAQVPQVINYQGRVAVQGVNFTGTGQFKFALVDGGVNYNQGATAFATVAGGQVSQITVTNIGHGYTAAPAVTITGEGTGATAVAVLGLGSGTGTGPTDSVYQINITNPGSGYTTATVAIAPPSPDIHHTTYWSNDGSSTEGSEPGAAVEIPVVNGLYSVALGDTTLPGMSMLPENLFKDRPDVRLRVWFDDGTHGSQLLTPDQRITAAPYAMEAGRALNVTNAAITTLQLADDAVTAAKIAPAAVSLENLLITSGNNAAMLNGEVNDGAPAGKVLVSDGNGGMMLVDGSAVGFSLPHVAIVDDNGPLLKLTNEGNGMGIEISSLFNDGIKGITAVAGKSGILGVNDAPPPFGNAPRGQGVFGFGSDAAAGVLGVSHGNDGVVGATEASSKSGVFGTSTVGNGVSGFSSGAGKSGVFGFTGAAGTYGGSFLNSHADGIALKVFGKADMDGDLTVRSTDLWLGSAARRGAPGRALVDWVDPAENFNQLFINFGNDWEDTVIGGDITRVKGILSAENLFIGKGDGQFQGNLTVTNNLTVSARAKTGVLEITGGADLAEPFTIKGSDVIPKGSVVVISNEGDGTLEPAICAYDKRVAGVISGANGVRPGISLRQEGVNDGGQEVALTGRVYCLCDATEDAIEPGDLLTTSATPGHAMKVTDHQRAQGAVLGKAMSALDEGKGFVLVLVTLQ